MTKGRAESRTISALVGHHVMVRRAAARMNQTDLAEAMLSRGHASWSHSAVSETERGKRNVTVDELVGLADTFGVAPEVLLRDPLSGT